MHKNITDKEAHIRTVASIVLLFTALLFIDAPVVKILLASIAAILAGTAFFRTCPLYMFLKKDREGEVQPLEEITETLEEKEEVDEKAEVQEEKKEEIEGGEGDKE